MDEVEGDGEDEWEDDGFGYTLRRRTPHPSSSSPPPDAPAAGRGILPTGMLVLGEMCCPIYSEHTPILHVRGEGAGESGIEAGSGLHGDGLVSSSSFFVLPTDQGTTVCMALDPTASVEAQRAFYGWLSSRATVLTWLIPPWEDDTLLTAPPVADADQPAFNSTIHRSSRALQHLMLGTARAVAVSCAVVSYGAHAVRTARATRQGGQEPSGPAVVSSEDSAGGEAGSEASARLRRGLSSTRGYLKHIAEVSDTIGRAVLQGGMHALQATSFAAAAFYDNASNSDSRISRAWREHLSPQVHFCIAHMRMPHGHVHDTCACTHDTCTCRCACACTRHVLMERAPLATGAHCRSCRRPAARPRCQRRVQLFLGRRPCPRRRRRHSCRRAWPHVHLSTADIFGCRGRGARGLGGRHRG